MPLFSPVTPKATTPDVPVMNILLKMFGLGSPTNPGEWGLPELFESLNAGAPRVPGVPMGASRIPERDWSVGPREITGGDALIAAAEELLGGPALKGLGDLGSLGLKSIKGGGGELGERGLLELLEELRHRTQNIPGEGPFRQKVSKEMGDITSEINERVVDLDYADEKNVLDSVDAILRGEDPPLDDIEALERFFLDRDAALGGAPRDRTPEYDWLYEEGHLEDRLRRLEDERPLGDFVEPDPDSLGLKPPRDFPEGKVPEDMWDYPLRDDPLLLEPKDSPLEDLYGSDIVEPWEPGMDHPDEFVDVADLENWAEYDRPDLPEWESRERDFFKTREMTEQEMMDLIEILEKKVLNRTTIDDILYTSPDGGMFKMGEDLETIINTIREMPPFQKIDTSSPEFRNMIKRLLYTNALNEGAGTLQRQRQEGRR